MRRATGPRALAALAAANARYWPTVAPVVQRELRRWQTPAASIGDPQLRALATTKLAEERFNAEVAATLATLAPRPQRTAVTQAIVALELLFDYLDGRTEQTTLAEAQRLFEPFIRAVAVTEDDVSDGGAAGASPRAADWEYLSGLSSRTRTSVQRLPAYAAIAQALLGSARRCAEGQARLHAALAGEPQAAATALQGLEHWASENGRDSGLEWREYLAGCASSVLAVHALIAAAADPNCGLRDAAALDATYLPIAAVITILDSVVDEPQDRLHGRRGFSRLYERRELPERIATLTREALARAREAPHAAHHTMTLAGVAAYYTTHPGARRADARPLVQAVRKELTPTIWPALSVMRGWRAAKRVRSLTRDGGWAPRINSSDGEKP